MSLWRHLWWTRAYFNVRRKLITQHDVENKQLKEENEKIESRKVESRKEENEKLKKENEQLRKNNVDVKIKESIEKSIEIEKSWRR